MWSVLLNVSVVSGYIKSAKSTGSCGAVDNLAQALTDCKTFRGVKRQRVLSVSSSSINKRQSSVFHLPGPGDSRVPQLLRARCLIVLFVYLAAPFHILCCWWWENIQQYSRDSVLPLPSSCPSVFPSSHFPSLTPSPYSVLWPRLLSISSKLSLRKKLWSYSRSHNNAGGQPWCLELLSVSLTPVQAQWEGQKWNKRESNLNQDQGGKRCHILKQSGKVAYQVLLS